MTDVELKNDLALANWHIERLQVNLATVQSENRRLRRMTTNGKQGNIAHRANADARQLVVWRFANYTISRRQCRNYGLSERRWQWGVAMLRLANIVTLNGSVDDFAIEDFDQCVAAIDKATRRVENNGLSLLVFRMAKGRVKVSKR